MLCCNDEVINKMRKPKYAYLKENIDLYELLSHWLNKALNAFVPIFTYSLYKCIALPF